MNKDHERVDCFSMLTVKTDDAFGTRARRLFQYLSRLGRMGAIAIVISATWAETGGDWGLQSARADTLLLGLRVTGPPTVTAGRPQTGIKIQLKNPGLAAPASRLRLLIRNEADLSLNDGDIKIDVREGGVWKPIALEAVDGGVMGAIGSPAPGEAHKERHKRGGFEIAAHLHQAWQLRVTLRFPGVYSLVTAISPDNGSTQLAQPASLRMEAI